MAFATSDTSARVGRAAETIDSSICVATITGVRASRARRMMSFWATGTSSRGTSTPRSPRATMTAVVAARISSRRPRASGRSSLATTWASDRYSLMTSRTSRTSAAERTNDTPT